MFNDTIVAINKFQVSFRFGMVLKSIEYFLALQKYDRFNQGSKKLNLDAAIDMVTLLDNIIVV